MLPGLPHGQCAFVQQPRIEERQLTAKVSDSPGLMRLLLQMVASGSLHTHTLGEGGLRKCCVVPADRLADHFFQQLPQEVQCLLTLHSLPYQQGPSSFQVAAVPGCLVLPRDSRSKAVSSVSHDLTQFPWVLEQVL